jgi:hypothetical protein
MRRKFIHPAVATGAAVAVTVMMTAAAAGRAGGIRVSAPVLALCHQPQRGASPG